jgi:hypothetical protein
MRKLLPLLLLASLACSFFSAQPSTTGTANPPASPGAASATPGNRGDPLTAATVTPDRATATAAPATATLAPTQAATTAPLTAVPTGTAAPEPAGDGAYHLRPEHVRFHPDPQLYSGDLVSLEVIAEGAPAHWNAAGVQLFVDSREGEPLARTTFGRYGLGGRMQATFTWVWDTTGRVGQQTVIVVVTPGSAPGADAPAEEVLPLTVSLLPAEARPAPEPQAMWARAESVCCVFNYLTQTAAARDIDLIRAEADAAFAHVAEVLGVTQEHRVVFTLVSRLLGHGGFASGEISLSYLDRNPAVTTLHSVFTHEGTHILDRRLSQRRPVMLTEGLAVYVAGGHFKPEALLPRAAAVLALDRYIPLRDLANGFYPAQHEIGYLEAGAFIEYLVARDGWDRFRAMYGGFLSAPTEAEMLDAGLRASYGLTLDEMEAEWLAYLRDLPADPVEMEDLRLTVALFDTLRRYQQALDPSAHFLTAWLPDGRAARERGLVADFLRHPQAPANITLEAMLDAAGSALLAGDYPAAAGLLDAANAALNAGDPGLVPLAADYAHVVQALLAEGYEAQDIVIEAQTAYVSAIRDWPQLEALTLLQVAGGWEVMASQ